MSSKLEKLKNNIDEAIKKPQVSIEELTKMSNDIDEEIIKSYMNYSISTKERYKNYIDRTDKEYVIEQIKKDLSSKYYNITTLEVDILSENIYDYCCLMINDISKQDIVSYILDKNNKIHDSLTEKQIKSMKVDANLKYTQFLISKYSKILKSNKRSIKK